MYDHPKDVDRGTDRVRIRDDVGSGLKSRFRCRRGKGGHRARSGFSLMELMVVVAILTITLSMFSSMMVSTSRITPIHRENARAAYMASNVIEGMRNLPFDQMWKSYNPDPLDDPGGAGTAAGPHFDIQGLLPQAGDADGRVGEVVMPTVGTELREDVVIPELGMPRDLNGDGLIDDQDHSGDHILLPILIRVEWSGQSGERDFNLVTMIINA